MAINPLIKVEHGRHGIEHNLTSSQLVAAGEAHIGIKIRIPLYATVDSILVEEDRLGVSYIKYDITVMSRETRYNGATRVLDVFTRAAGEWSRTDRFEAADEAFRPHAVHESGTPHRDEIEQRIRRAYEADCHRPGGGRAPLDNADRTAEGYTTPAMVRHWS